MGCTTFLWVNIVCLPLSEIGIQDELKINETMQFTVSTCTSVAVTDEGLEIKA
jgi:hypothetical protein